MIVGGYPERCVKPPWLHQLEGTRTLIERPKFILWDDVGMGKSKQVVDAVCELFIRGEVDSLVVVVPGFARSVWASLNPLLGEFVQHVWPGINYELNEYSAHSKFNPARQARNPMQPTLQIVVTNYEFIRRHVNGTWPNLTPLRKWAALRSTWLVLDESWSIESYKAHQAKACYLLRTSCQRVTLLNGTPGAPERLFTQFQILDPKILDVKNYFHFRARYLIMGGFDNREVVDYQRMDDFHARTKDYALRREGGLDLPERMPPITIEARLNDKEWAIYKAMRDDLVAWIDEGNASVARQAGVRTLRLCQILAGFVGGVENIDPDNPNLFETPVTTEVREIGRAKLDAVLDFLSAVDLQKVILWCGFKPEMDRLGIELAKHRWGVHYLRGDQKPAERDATKEAFAPGSPEGRLAMVGHPRAGGAGLNFSGASMAIHVTNGWSWRNRHQADGRIDRPGQKRRPRFVDVVATGPDGQKTVDHGIVAALRSSADTADWTAGMWRRVLTDE